MKEIYFRTITSGHENKIPRWAWKYLECTDGRPRVLRRIINITRTEMQEKNLFRIWCNDLLNERIKQSPVDLGSETNTACATVRTRIRTVPNLFNKKTCRLFLALSIRSFTQCDRNGASRPERQRAIRLVDWHISSGTSITFFFGPFLAPLFSGHTMAQKETGPFLFVNAWRFFSGLIRCMVAWMGRCTFTTLFSRSHGQLLLRT